MLNSLAIRPSCCSFDAEESRDAFPPDDVRHWAILLIPGGALLGTLGPELFRRGCNAVWAAQGLIFN
jgi:hypothetical protein